MAGTGQVTGYEKCLTCSPLTQSYLCKTYATCSIHRL